MSPNIARHYQEDAVNAVLISWGEYDRVLLHSGTGSGKNFMAARLIESVQPARCLMICDQNELVAQSATAIDRFAGIVPAIEKAERRAGLRARVIVSSIQTLCKRSRLEAFPPDFISYILCDEAHRISDTKAKVFDYFYKAKVCGLTGTPFRSTVADLSKWYEEVAFSMPMLDLVNDGFAPPIKVLTIPVEIDLSEVETKRGFEGKDYDAESLSTTIEPYYRKIAGILKEQAFDRKTIAFLPLIKSSEAFAAICRETGLQAIHVDGKDPDREEKILAFSSGRYQVICNSSLLTTGVDMPIADCFLNLTPMRSMVRYQQAYGRVMRVLPGVIDDLPGKDQAEERKAKIAASAKKDVLILDLLWCHDQLGVIRPGHLVATNEADAKAIYEKVKKQRTPEDLQAIAKLVQEEREAAVVKRLEAVALRAGGAAIEPRAFGFLIGSKALMEYEPIARWEMESPSPRQLEALGKFAIDVAEVKTKGYASRLLDAAISRCKFKLATTRQLQALSRLGVAYDPRMLTFRDASNLITKVKLESSRKSKIAVDAT